MCTTRRARQWRHAHLTFTGNAEVIPEPQREADRSSKWVRDRMSAWSEARWGRLRVDCLVPAGFERYVRLLHRVCSDAPGRQWRWSEVAQDAGRELLEETQWATLTADLRERDRLNPPIGELSDAEFRSLAATLEKYTASPDDCRFAFWEGSAFVDHTSEAVSIGGRAYVVFKGSANEAIGHRFGDGFAHPPNLWWSADRSWCVATDIDLDSTYIGAGRACASRIRASSELEVLLTRADARVDAGADARPGQKKAAT